VVRDPNGIVPRGKDTRCPAAAIRWRRADRAVEVSIYDKRHLRRLSTSALWLMRCAGWSKSYGLSWRTSCRRRSREA